MPTDNNINDLFCLDSLYSTTRLITRKNRLLENQHNAKFDMQLISPVSEYRYAVGGLRTQGYFKKNTNGKPLITVITVVFNGKNYLEETIQSVINQTYANVEYIIIDGGSTDGTLDLICKYEGQIDYWVSEKDEGIYYAMNKGVDLATGEWINFMNSGDSFYNNTTIESIFNRLIIGSVIYGNTLYQYGPEYHKIQKTSKDLTFKYGLPFCHQSSFVKTAILKVNKFSKKYKIYADFELFANLVKVGEKFIYVDLTIAKFVCNGVSAAKSLNHLNELYDIRKQHNVFYAVLLILDLIIREAFKKILPIRLVKWIQILK